MAGTKKNCFCSGFDPKICMCHTDKKWQHRFQSVCLHPGTMTLVPSGLDGILSAVLTVAKWHVVVFNRDKKTAIALKYDLNSDLVAK